LLRAAQDALVEVRKREPGDSRHRRTGPDILSAPKAPDGTLLTGIRKPAPTPLSFAWESDNDDDDDDDDRRQESGFNKSFHENTGSIAATRQSPDLAGGGATGQNRLSIGGGGGGGVMGGDVPGGASNSLDSWFGGKVDTGPMVLRPSAMKPSAQTQTVGMVSVLDRPSQPESLEFSSEASGRVSTVFPADLALRFQSEEDELAVEAAMGDLAPTPTPTAPAIQGENGGGHERTSGEEFGPNGYWYRWTEIQGQDATGAVQWVERWWEASDWRGMKEMGAEKLGHNARGDAWRETWRETIAVDDATGQPKVERAAHKWARAGEGREWEEKWEENYWSGGRTEKWADKWGKEGTDVWHEKWGESYDGQGNDKPYTLSIWNSRPLEFQKEIIINKTNKTNSRNMCCNAGGCVKWTDRWAERPPGLGALGLDKWGEKWEERFKDGQGSKNGETWSESAGGDRYQRWWGENHFGDGYVQKFGHSSTGEHWDVTEQMDTYYNPIPHFGYDLALAHSPQLRKLPTLPRDDALDLVETPGGDGAMGREEGKGKGKGKSGGKRGRKPKKTPPPTEIIF